MAPTPHPAMTFVLADSFTMANAMTWTANATAALVQTARDASGDPYAAAIANPVSAMTASVRPANRATGFIEGHPTGTGRQPCAPAWRLLRAPDSPSAADTCYRK